MQIAMDLPMRSHYSNVFSQFTSFEMHQLWPNPVSNVTCRILGLGEKQL